MEDNIKAPEVTIPDISDENQDAVCLVGKEQPYYACLNYCNDSFNNVLEDNNDKNFIELGARQSVPIEVTLQNVSYTTIKSIPFFFNGTPVTESGQAIPFILTNAQNIPAKVYFRLGIQCTYNDGIFVKYSQKVGMSLQENLNPAVNAGADQVVCQNTVISVAGIVTDDGLPLDNPLSSNWQKMKGPGSCLIDDSTSASSTAIFSEPGEYVLRLEANDGEKIANDFVTFLVIPESGSLNINFQPTDITVPDGYFPDYGNLYGVQTSSSYVYGWSVAHVLEPRARGSANPIELDILIHMLTWAKWEIALPNGLYQVTASCRRPNYFILSFHIIFNG